MASMEGEEVATYWVEMPWHQPDTGREFVVRLGYQLVPRVQVVEFRLVSADGGPVTSRARRDVPQGEFEDATRPGPEELRREHLARAELIGEGKEFTDFERGRLAAMALRTADETAEWAELRQVAEVYRSAWQAGRNDLWRAVQEAFPTKKEWTLARLIKRAKDQGLIPPGVRPFRGRKDKR